MNPDLDNRLAESAPRLADVPDLEPVLAELVQATRTAPRRRPVDRRGVLIGTTTAGIVLAGTAAAAALGLGPWLFPAGQNPDGSLAFTMPDGVACEYRIGDFTSYGDPDKLDKLEAWLGKHTLEEIADVDAAIETIRRDQLPYVRKDGTEVPVGYGTPYYDPKSEYYDAVQRAINDPITEYAVEIGILKDDHSSFANSAEIRCADGWLPNADWMPQP